MAFVESLSIKINSDGVRAAVRRLKTLGSAAKRAGVAVGVLLRRVAKLGVGAFRAAIGFKGLISVIGATLAIRKAINEFTEFEFQMAKVKAVSGATALEFANLSKLTRTLGATTVFTAQEAGQALLYLSQAGLTAAESTVALPQTLQLAQAGFLDLPIAADIAVSSLKGFGLAVNELGRVGDVLANTAASSKVTIQTLGQAFSFTAPLSRALGVSIEETAAIIGVLGNRGLNAGRAGRGLNQFFAQLSKATPDTIAVLKRYGLTLDDVNIKTKGAINVIEKLDEANLSVADTYKIFGKIGGLVALSLKSATTETRRLAIANKEAEGAMRKMAKTMNDTTRGLRKGLTSALSEAWIQLGQNLNPAFKNFARIITGALSVMNGMGEQFFKLNNVTKTQRERIKDLGIVFFQLKLGITSALTAFINLGPKLVEFTTVTLKNALISLNKFLTDFTGISDIASKIEIDKDQTLSGKFAYFFATTIVSSRRFFIKLGDYWTVGLNSLSGILGKAAVGWAKIFALIPNALGGQNFKFASEALQDTLLKVEEDLKAATGRLSSTVNVYSQTAAFEDKALLINTFKEYKKGFKDLDSLSVFGNKKAQVEVVAPNYTGTFDLFQNEEIEAYAASVKRAEAYSKTVTEIIGKPAEELKDSLADALLTSGNIFNSLLDAAKSFVNDLNKILLKKYITGPLIDSVVSALGGLRTPPPPGVPGPGVPLGNGSGAGNLASITQPAGFGSTASSQSKVTIIDQRRNAPPVRQQQRSNGNIELVINDSVKKNINSGGFDGVLGSNFEVKRRGTF